ncbi:MAG: Rpn family recombination-promoting nuclease/putative transposase [Methylomonas sp.]|jgi:predicted transposase/invertase (TIGR01784 family)
MRHPINPQVDCVFKALLGAEENRNLLVHFLNAILGKELQQPIVSVDILNPYNDREFQDAKLSIVDVKAKDSLDRLYQVEIQISNFRHLSARILYNWADIYSKQLKSGQDYLLLKPTYSIWLLAEDLITNDNRYEHVYKHRDEQGLLLNEHCTIYLLELNKYNDRQISSEKERWLMFFKDGENLDEAALPDWMATPEMQQAMNTLSVFSDKEHEYHLYQARQEYLREQRTREIEREQDKEAMLRMAKELEAERLEKEAERQAKEVERQAKEASQQREAEAQQREAAALAEIDRLKALLSGKDKR